MLIRRTVSTEQNRHKRPKRKNSQFPSIVERNWVFSMGQLMLLVTPRGGLVNLFHRSNVAIGMCGYDDVDTLKRFEFEFDNFSYQIFDSVGI